MARKPTKSELTQLRLTLARQKAEKERVESLAHQLGCSVALVEYLEELQDTLERRIANIESDVVFRE